MSYNGINKAHYSSKLRSLFFGTTSLYALLLSAPVVAQEASNNCVLPTKPIIGSVTIPTTTNQIFADTIRPNVPNAYFLNCASKPEIGYIFNPFGNMVIINTSDSTVDTSTIDGGISDSPNVPTFGAFADGDSLIAVANFGQINSTGIAMTGGTITGDLTGYNSGIIYTNYNVTSPFLQLNVSAPLAPGMVFVSGSANQSGIFSTSTGQTAGIYSVGGNGVSGVNAGAISLVNEGTITTGGLSSPGMVAIAAGGQGGVGQSANASNKYISVAVGGSGGGGGNGGTVTVENSSSITTLGLNSMAIKALSVGGGGGSGGTAFAQSTGNNLVSASFSLAIGGSGGVGGDGEAVTVDLKDGSTIQTGSTSTTRSYTSFIDRTIGTYIAGDHSPGVLAQSIGGGGGSGGHAVSLAQGGGLVSVAVAVSKGGTGGAGGDGEAVTVTSNDGASIVTGGRFAGGIIAQSIGGGGGSGGTVNSQADSSGVISANVSVAMGADGGAGGSSGYTQALLNGGSVTTYGTHSTGILAQSIAGGGGNGGNVVDGSGVYAPLSVSLQVNMGGNAGNGATSGGAAANVGAGATLTTYGDHSIGVLAQSIGGGGGNGGSVHSYSDTTGGGSVADSITENKSSSLTLHAGVSLGGSGGVSANAGNASSGIVGSVQTYGIGATGVMVQSIGGGGGNGGNIHAYSSNVNVDTEALSSGKLNNSAINATIDLGGAGGSAGNGGDAVLALWGGQITTNQIRSSGLVAQSIGGGGGNGGYSSSIDVTTSIPTSPSDLATRYASLVPGSDAKATGNLDVSFNLGGSSGGGGNGGSTLIQLDGGQVTTLERQSHGAFAQSVGGGGGIGGHATANGFVGVGTYSFNAALGGRGGIGGDGGAVRLYRDNSSASISNFSTHGDQSYGIFAQSIGGGGGSAGAAHIDLEKAPAGLSNLTLSLTLGGSGGTGGSGSTVDISDAVINTSGIQSHGVMAQSIGGGGGNATLSGGGGATTLSLGGTGGNGGDGGALTLQNIQSTTNGDLAAGIFAQSIGGGGGLAGIAGTNTLLDEVAQSTVNTLFNLDMGGASGDGSSIFVGCETGRTDATCDISASTIGTTAAGIVLQSIGGGGSSSFVNNDNASINVDFTKGAIANSGLISLSDENGGSFNIATSGNGAVGIVAQSFAGSGGALFTDGSLSDVTVTTGNILPGGRSGGLDFNLDAAVISTSGDYAPGLYLQSGNAVYTVFAADGQQTHRQTNSFGSLETSYLQVNNRLFLNKNSSITTSGTQSHGIVMDTYSYFGSTGAPSSDINDRSLNMWIDGKIAATGDGSWGVIASNSWDISSLLPIPLPNNITTSFTLGADASITVGASANGGGVQLSDSGNLLANINGMIDVGTTGTLVDITAANTFLNFGNPDADTASQIYHGTIKVTGSAAGGTNTIVLNRSAMLYGTIISDTSAGAINDITLGGNIYNRSNTAMSFGTFGAAGSTIRVNEVFGHIMASQESNFTANLINEVGIYGNVTGAFDYHMNTDSIHVLMVDAGPGYAPTGGFAHPSSEIIHVNSFSQDAGSAISLTMKTLPSSLFNDIFNIVTLEDGLGKSLADFNFENSAATTYSLVGFQDGNRYEISIRDIEINLNQNGLQGIAAQLAPLAQRHINDIRETEVPNPNTAIYKLLLNSANAASLDGLTTELEKLNGASSDLDVQSNVVAQRNATDAMHSCGGEQGAAINPVEQGECSWASVIRTNVELGNGSHDEQSTNLAVGWQNSIGSNSFLGFTFGYDNADIGRTASTANTERLHLGAIYKYVDNSFFASSSLMASYAATDAQRVYGDILNETVTNTATSNRKSLALFSRMRVGYKIGEGTFDLTPMVDIDLSLNHQFQYEEAGAGGLESYVGATGNFLADLHPRVQLGSHFDVGSVNVRLYGEFGQRFALNDASINFGLASGLAGDAMVSVIQEREKSQSSWGVGMIADLGKRFEMRVTYDKTKGAMEKNERLGFKIAYKF